MHQHSKIACPTSLHGSFSHTARQAAINSNITIGIVISLYNDNQGEKR